MKDNPDFKVRLFDFYRSAYNAELERKEKLNTRLTFNLAIITVVANICVSYVGELPAFRCDIFIILLYGLLGLSGIALCIALVFFCKALGFPKGFDYGYIPKTTQIYGFLKQADKYNETVSTEDQISIQAEFENNLMAQYNGYSSRNADNNNRKTRYIYFTFTFSLYAAIFAILTAPLYFMNREKTASQKVEIISPVKIQAP